MADTDSPLAQVDHLLQQREQYEQWLARLDGGGSKAPEPVRKKVRADYEARLEGVVSELRSHASAVESALGGHQDSLSTLEARRADVEERLAEAEIRHSVGEYTDDEWSAVGSEAESALEEIGRRISAEQGEITRLAAVLHLVAKPAAPAAPVPTIRMATPMAEPAEPEAPAQPVSGAPRFVPKTPGATPRANPPAPRQAAPVDELAFLKSVTGEHPTRKMPPKKTSDSGPMRAVDVAPPPSAVVEAEAEAAAPTARPGTPSNAKTLKCGECGTLNRPTEWYCERCGAELAAL
jgi:hypothetical protein